MTLLKASELFEMMRQRLRRVHPTESLDIHWCAGICSSGLVIKADYMRCTESYLHISNEFEECHSQLSRLVLAPTTASSGCRWLMEQGPLPQSAQCSALLASCFTNWERATSKIYCHLSLRTTTY